MSISKLRELGVMIDCSRNAVVTIQALKELMDVCSAFGYDFVGLYMEDTFEVSGEPYFGYQRGRFTREEIREADAYASKLGMELRPYIQTLAHINQIVDYTDYAGIIDVNDILLIGDPKTEKLLDKLIKTVSENFSSRTINIGMDEAHMVGLGKYLEKHGYRDRVELILSHLDMVAGLCRKYGLKPQMWSDMFFRLLSDGAYGTDNDEASGKLSESMADRIRIPDGLELVYWDYYSVDSTHYEKIIDQHKAFAPHISFAGGAWRWMGFTPYNSFSIMATKAAMKACLSKDIDSFVMTMWGDDGTECSIYALLPALYRAAVDGGKISDINKGTEDRFTETTGYGIDEFMLLDLANPGCSGAKRNNLSKILLFNDPLLGIYDSLVPDNAADYFKETAEKLLTVTENRKEPGRFDYVFKTQELLCKVLQLKADLGIRIRDAYLKKDTRSLSEITEKEIPELISRLDSFYEAFRGQWLNEAKAFGFEVQTIRIGGLRLRLQDISRTLKSYVKGEISVIEELDTEALPVGYCLHGESVNAPEYNRYEKIATTSRLSW